MIIGVTGNIGSGKSLAIKTLAQCGAAVIDADKVGHSVLLKGGAAYDKLIEAFGEEFLDENGEFIRSKLGAHVFSDPSGKRLETLNSITHPAIFLEVARLCEQRRAENYPMVVVEAALLLDSALIEIVEQVWLVTAPYEVLLDRVQKRDNCDRATAEQRLRSQRSTEEMIKMSDKVFVNDGEMDVFCEQIRQAYAEAVNQ